MKKVLIIGGGLAGSVIADELSSLGIKSIILEKSDNIGGKVREYGCKASDECTNCGMCLVKDLFSRVEKNKNIEINENSVIQDCYGIKGDFNIVYKKNGKNSEIKNISEIVLATGYKNPDTLDFYGFQLPKSKNIIRGHSMEILMKERGIDTLFEKTPKKVGFIQCFGSRDKSSGTNYCSKICCNYSTRMARVIKKYYPECEVDMFCMDMQQVERGKFFDFLKEKGINLIKSRPAMISIEGEKPIVRYETSPIIASTTNDYDYLILSDGIIPNLDNEHLSEILGLYMNKDGFLKEVTSSKKTGIYTSGCVYAPMGISDTYKMSQDVAKKLYSNRK